MVPWFRALPAVSPSFAPAAAAQYSSFGHTHPPFPGRLSPQLTMFKGAVANKNHFFLNQHNFCYTKGMTLFFIYLCMELNYLSNVTGSGKRDIFAHIFKIELLAPQGRVSSQL